MIFGRKKNNEPTVGQGVMTSDEEDFGAIQAVQDDYLVIEAGTMDHRSLWHVPRSAISKIDDECVHLNVTRGQMLGKGWQQSAQASGQDLAQTNI